MRSMMSSKQRLEIALEPQGKARAPRYPGHLDPRPTDVGGGDSALVKRVASHLAALSLGLAAPSLVGCASAHAGSGKRATSAKIGPNPFGAKLGGFPIHPIHFGTGDPSRLSEKDGRAVVERLLRQAGLKLAANVDPKLPGVKVTLDGWEAKRRVGFEFVAWGDYEYDKKKWRHSSRVNPSALSFVEIERLDELSKLGKAYVAVVNHRRYAYGPFALHFDAAYRAKSKAVQATKDSKSRKKLKAELDALGKKLIAEGKAPALRRLEADVKRFIVWLRAQGVL